METEEDKNTNNSGESDQPLEPVHEAVRKETATPVQRGSRAWIFQVYILVSLIGFAALAFMVTVFEVSSFDIGATRTVQAGSPPWLQVLLVWTSWFGYAVQSITVTFVLVGALYFLGLRWESASLAVASVGAWALNNLIKVSIQRPRPTDDLVEVFAELNSYSFPSGHVMYYTAFFGFLAFLSYTLLKRRWLRALLVFLFGSMVILVGPSRVYLGEHWTSDVVAAYLLGFLCLFGVIYLYRIGKKRFGRDQPVAPGKDEVTPINGGKEGTS